MIKKISYKDLIIFVIPILIFGIYLWIYNPGILSYDSYYQLNQIHTMNFNNWHPFFHTFIELVCLKIYDNPISVAIFQILVFSFIWSYICKYIRQKYDENNKMFLFLVLFTIFIAILPINAIYSITLWKDILFSYSLLFLSFLIYKFIDKNYEIDMKFIIVISLTLACVWHLRPNGKYIAFVILVIIIGLLLKNKDRIKTIMMISITIVSVIVISTLNIVFNVKNNEKDAIETKIAHLLSYYALNIEIEENDKNNLHKLLTEEEIEENFNIYFSDPIYGILNKEEYENNKKDYIWLAFKYSVKNPSYFIKYYFQSSSIVWRPIRNENWIGNTYNTNINSVNNDFNYTPVNIGTRKYNIVNSFVNFANKNIVLNTVFSNVALYMYLSIILMIILNKKYKVKNIILVYLPNLINIFIVSASTPIQDTRYLYPNLLICYLLILILIEQKVKMKNFISGKDN